MSNDDLLARQREALVTLRRARQERQEAERGAKQTLETLRREAKKQRQRIQTQLKRAHNCVEKIESVHLLEDEAMSFSPADFEQDPTAALAQWANRACQAAAGVENSVGEWQTFHSALAAAESAKQHAQSAEESVAEAKQADQSIDHTWETLRPSRRWKGAAYFRYQVEQAKREAVESCKQAEAWARDAFNEANRAKAALSSSESVATIAQVTAEAETRAGVAAQKAAVEAETAREAAGKAEQAAEKAMSAARTTAKTWWIRVFALALLLLVIAVILHSLGIMPGF